MDLTQSPGLLGTHWLGDDANLTDTQFADLARFLRGKGDASPQHLRLARACAALLSNLVQTAAETAFLQDAWQHHICGEDSIAYLERTRDALAAELEGWRQATQQGRARLNAMRAAASSMVAAAARQRNDNAAVVDRLHREIADAAREAQGRVKRLEAAGLSATEIERAIGSQDTAAIRTATQARIDTLEAENAAIGAYLESAPLYDQDMLDGIKLRHLAGIEHSKCEMSLPPAERHRRRTPALVESGSER